MIQLVLVPIQMNLVILPSIIMQMLRQQILLGLQAGTVRTVQQMVILQQIFHDAGLTKKVTYLIQLGR